MNEFPKLLVREGGYAKFWCPGCEEFHYLHVKPGQPAGWEYNGNADAPTLSPSVLVRQGHHVPGQKQPPNCWYCNEAAKDGQPTFCYQCHSYVKDGMIQFLDDCTHRLKGQTVPLPNIEPWM
jgi:hypothetical protein